MLTAEKVRELLHYDPETGVLTRAIRTSNRVKTGAEAGTIHEVKAGQFYRYVCIGGRKYPAHRLAWLHFHGEWPEKQIDHKDGNGLNNRIANLRLASQTLNNANTKRRVDNASGAKGVCWSKRQGQWRAYIRSNGRQKHLGYFATVREAAEAYRRASVKLFGDFAVQNRVSVASRSSHATL